jgi:AcrR family transcriptional regulator
MVDAPPTRAARQVKERDAIMHAAYGLVGQASGESASVQQILDAAGLSTRAFYRHFPSKDELILTMYRTAESRVALELAQVVAAAPGPVEALHAWIERQLAVVYEPRRSRQTSVLTSAEARSAVGFDETSHQGSIVRRTVLADIIRTGQREGLFPLAADPDEDARAVASVVSGIIQARLNGEECPTWSDATRHITQLFLRSFGATVGHRD